MGALLLIDLGDDVLVNVAKISAIEPSRNPGVESKIWLDNGIPVLSPLTIDEIAEKIQAAMVKAAT